ncbi:hypothetical protein TWF225_007562 [Orbilia oligospora]|nr:hypothetical protein TWF751_001083 [Orbilia oligospora]KAF3179353.1 hypothetical protein TWF225_007562 [Orbilia oligospora]KAF3253180.1 hypothetical protein TWF128_006604 [Orbilia oligospora]
MGTSQLWRLLLSLVAVQSVWAVQYKAFGCGNNVADLQKQINTKYLQTPVWDYFGSLSKLVVCASGISGAGVDYCICPEYSCCGSVNKYCRSTDDYVNGIWVQRPVQCCSGPNSSNFCAWPNPKCFLNGGFGWECHSSTTQFCGSGGCDTNQGNYCCGSRCYRPGDGQVCCGGNKVCGSGTYCCNGDCIPWDAQCCEGQTYPTWCSSGNYCTPTMCVPNGVTLCPGGQIGCYTGSKCCGGNKCIANDATCCDNGGYCPAGKWCCGDQCGQNGDDCGWSAALNQLVLCPQSKWCGAGCCPHDYICTQNGGCRAPDTIACPGPFFGGCPQDRWCCGPRCGKSENHDSCCWSQYRSQEYLCQNGFCCGDVLSSTAGCCKQGWRCVNGECLPPEGQQLCPYAGVSCPNDQWCCGNGCGGPGANGDSCCWNPTIERLYICKNSECCGNDQCCTASQECSNGQCIQKPSLTAAYGVWKSIGCYTDSVNARALSNVVTDNTGMSVARCAGIAAGRKYMGVEYGVECHYGDSIASSSTSASNGCTMRCSGKQDELCGGGDRLNMYINTAFSGQGNDDWEYVGCYTDSSSTRALQFQLVDWNAMTIEMCLQTASGFAYAAVEYYGYASSFRAQLIYDYSINLSVPGIQMKCAVGRTESIFIGIRMFLPSCHFLSQQLLTGQSGSLDVATCVAAAEAEGYKYAAVENSGECWADFVLELGSLPVSNSECDKECNGKHSEICGGSDTFVLYQNDDFVDPSYEVAALITALTDLKTAYEDLKEAMDAVIELLQNSSQKKRRNIAPRQDNLSQAVQVMKQAARTCRRALTNAIYRVQRKSPAAHNYIRLNNMALDDQESLLDDAASALSSSSMLEVETASVASVITLGPTGLAVLNIAIRTLQIPAVGLLAYLLTFGHGGGSGTGTEPLECENDFYIPLVIMCKQGTTEKQYEAMIRRLPMHQDNVRMGHYEIDWKMYRVIISGCDSDKLIEFAVDPFGPILSIVYDEIINVETMPSRSFSKRSSPHEDGKIRKRMETEDLHPNKLFKRFPNTNLNGQDVFRYQPNAPSHLNWLSNPNIRQQSGRWYDVPDSYIFLEGEQGTGAAIYVIEFAGFYLSHDDYRTKLLGILPATDWGATHYFNNHGTCVASAAAGWYSGSSKGAGLVLVSPFHVRDNSGLKSEETWAWKLYQTLTDIVKHSNGQPVVYKGKAVINISATMSARLFTGMYANVWNSNNDWWDEVMVRLNHHQVALVVSAGNFHPDKIDADKPRGSGGSQTGMIVVGNSWLDDERHPKSQFEQSQGSRPGILTIYAAASGSWCADTTGQNVWVLEGGTSTGAGIVSGVIANMLVSYPNEVAASVAASGGVWGLGVKRLLIQKSREAKGSVFASDSDTPTTPRLAWGKTLICMINNPFDPSDVDIAPVSPLLDPTKPVEAASTTQFAAIMTTFPILAAGTTVDLPTRPECVTVI